MTIFVNDKATEVKYGTNLEDLSLALGMIEKKGWAFALNDSIVTKEEMEKITLTENDRVLLIQATQGG